MKRTRFEILLPLRYNDGERIEKHKFAHTRKEILDKFGAVTVDAVGVVGTWVYQGTRYDDRLIRLIVDVRKSRQAQAFFRSYKPKLKERFRQTDIWITSHEIDII